MDSVFCDTCEENYGTRTNRWMAHLPHNGLLLLTCERCGSDTVIRLHPEENDALQRAASLN